MSLALNAVEVVTIDDTLIDLATRATEEFYLARDYAVSAVQHAITCGELLLIVKRTIPTGTWRRWCVENVPEMSKSAIGRFTRLATYKEELDKAGEFPSITQAYEFLEGLRPMSNPDSRRNTRVARIRHQSHKFDFDRARELREQGLPYHAIAGEVGASQTAVRRALDNDAYVKALDANRARYVGRPRLTIEQRQQSVHRVGVAAIEAAAIVHKCALVLNRAINEAHDSTTRSALTAALDFINAGASRIDATIQRVAS